MTGRRIKQAKRCSAKGCNKNIRHWNKSGFCSLHYQLSLRSEYRAKIKKAKICHDCGSKIEPIITYPAGDTLPPIKKYPLRCYKCRQKIKIKREKDLETIKKREEVRISFYHHSNPTRQKRHRDSNKKKRLCLDCSSKIEPLIKYPAGDTIPPTTSYPIRCYKCKLMQEERKQKGKNKLVTIL